MGENEVRQASADSRRSDAATRAQQTGCGWATYALADFDGKQTAVVRIPLDRGVLDVIQCGPKFYVWNQEHGQYRRARVHYVTLADMEPNR
jgi:hypothetical protein